MHRVFRETKSVVTIFYNSQSVFRLDLRSRGSVNLPLITVQRRLVSLHTSQRAGAGVLKAHMASRVVLRCSQIIIKFQKTCAALVPV